MLPDQVKLLNGQQRHDYILQTFILNKKHKRDIDIIKEHHRFLWEDAPVDSWETKLAKSYYDKLFKEYCIADLTRYKENKVALRWRVENEVVTGKGQFECGSRKCSEREVLRSWEVNFAYLEQGDRKNALVKLRLCPEHSAQLNYSSRKREVKRLKQIEKQKSKNEKLRKRKHLKTGEEASPENTTLEKTEEEISVTSSHKESIKTPEETIPERFEEEICEDVWSNPIKEPITRESEFERYLEDLLL